MLRQFVLAVSVARSVIAPPVPLPQERSALGRLPGLALQFASHDYSYDEERVRSARATGNYYKNGQCRQKADGTPQWRKKKKNSWHDCGDHTICEEGSVGCECQAGYQGDAVKYPTCTACNAGTTSDAGASQCTAYSVAFAAFTEHSQCDGHIQSIGGNDDEYVVAVVDTGVSGGVANGAAACEAACEAATAIGAQESAGCCFLNAFNGRCKYYSGWFEASSAKTDETYSDYYFATTVDKYVAPFTFTCSGSGADLEAGRSKMCSGEATTVATLLLGDGQYSACYDACARYARLEGLTGTGCCRMNGFNGYCNYYHGGATSVSTSVRMRALDLSCSGA